MNLNYLIIDLGKIIFINFLLLFLSTQLFMLGIYSTLRAKQINIYKGNFLNLFFKYFKLRSALLIGIILAAYPIVYNYLNIDLFDQKYELIIFGLTSLLGINIMANSFFVSLLEIGEKDI